MFRFQSLNFPMASCPGRLMAGCTVTVLYTVHLPPDAPTQLQTVTTGRKLSHCVGFTFKTITPSHHPLLHHKDSKYRQRYLRNY